MKRQAEGALREKQPAKEDNLMAGELVVQLWKEWGLQTLVLLSFTLQIVLLILAEFRRGMDSGMLMAFLWPAYMLADSTAIYVLGHLWVTRGSPEHQLMAFWAPFLLLHLGGQDNITAYAIEDNQLWLRHLQTLAVQVAAAVNVLYEAFFVDASSSRSLLLPATIMFVVGVLKYGERVWALKCAIKTGSNYRPFDRSTAYAAEPPAGRRDMEHFLLIAHLLLDVPMDMLNGPSTFRDLHYGTSAFSADELYKLTEMQLSLMHDVFYTKAEVTHTWYGLCIRVFSLLGTATALLLFLLQPGEQISYSRVDIGVTYVLLVGAVILEIISALRAMFSSWTCAILERWDDGERRNVWYFHARALAFLRRLLHAADWRRYWSGSIGQHNLLQLCTRSWASKRSKIARWMGVEDPWNTFAYSFSVPVSECIKQLVKQVLESENDASASCPDHICNSRGRAVLKSRRKYEDLGWSIDDMELDESILVWHIATGIYLFWYKQEQAKTRDDSPADDAQLQLVEAAEGLSNYMLFLLAARPYMLPPSASRKAYIHACYFLTYLELSRPEDLASELRSNGSALNTTRSNDREAASSSRTLEGNTGDSSHYQRTLHRASQLGAKLIAAEELQGSNAADTLKLISQVWVEMLCYAAYRCGAHSHARQLSNGGEFITVVALLMEHIRRRTDIF
ncbi:hypothetical protein EJB05_06073, partial [Eragrostis curvula]